MSARTWIAAVAFATLIAGGARADDVKRLGGAAPEAKTLTLQGSPETDADTVQVFHGRILRWLFHKPYAGYYASGYSNGCYGGYAGYGCNGCYGGSACFGCYGGSGCFGCVGYASPTFGNGYSTSGYYGNAPAAAPYSASAAAIGVYGAARPVVPPSTSVTVTTPRFALNVGASGLNLSSPALTNGRLVGRTGRPIAAPPKEQLPTPRTRPDSYQYDGGPARPVPMPGDGPAAPAPEGEGPVLPSVVNRAVIAAKAKPAYPAYGETAPRRTGEAPVSNLVKNHGQ